MSHITPCPNMRYLSSLEKFGISTEEINDLTQGFPLLDVGNFKNFLSHLTQDGVYPGQVHLTKREKTTLRNKLDAVIDHKFNKYLEDETIKPNKTSQEHEVL